MGAAMAGHLVDAGARLTVHTRTAARAEPLIAAGARWAETPRRRPRRRRRPLDRRHARDVQAVYFGAGARRANRPATTASWRRPRPARSSST
ncbi:MAG: NAD(P)-binding domain-containing protein [Anaerolineae bacterium]